MTYTAPTQHTDKLVQLIVRILRTPLMTIVGSVFLGIFATWSWDHAKHWLEMRPFHDIWGKMLEGQDYIPVAIGGMEKLREFEIEGQGKAQLPPNVPALGAQETFGVSRLGQSITNEFGADTFVLYQHTDFDHIKINKSFVAVGGWSVNSITRDILHERKIDKYFDMVYPQHYAKDEADGVTYKATPPDSRDGPISEDYGFIVIGPNPYDNTKTVILAFGIWPQGTQAAMEALAEPDTNSPQGRQFIDLVKEGKGLVAVVKTEVTGVNQTRPSLVKVRPLIQEEVKRSQPVGDAGGCACPPKQ